MNEPSQLKQVRKKQRDLAYVVLKQRLKAAGINPRSIEAQRLITSAKRQGL